MRMAATFAVIVWSCAVAVPALADIPITDAAQLTRRSETASVTVKLVPITTQRQEANGGVKCAVTTGKKADVTDPTVQPQPGSGRQMIRPFAPDMPAAPAPGAQGAALNSQTLFKSAGDVIAGLNASRSTLGAAQLDVRTASQQVGTAPTVMAALDMNSAARLRNNLAWNSAIGSANLWVTALNALNLAMTSDLSRAASGMRTATTLATNAIAPACPDGTIGSGTFASPCRPATSCSTTPPGTPTDPGCVTGRYANTDGNVLFTLARIQEAAQGAAAAAPAMQAPATRAPTVQVSTVQAPLLTKDGAALANIQSSAR
jgi:hypothetical protein